MDSRLFSELCFNEKQALLSTYLNKNSGSTVARDLFRLNLDQNQLQVANKILESVISDTFYTILMALDGAGSLGGTQIEYSLKDDKGNEVTGNLESEAFRLFHRDDDA